MTIPRIALVHGDRHTEGITLLCTGCNEFYTYSVRQYKGDFGCNISEFESFLQWAKWEAARHECFLVGRMGYLPPDFFEGVEKGVAAAKAGHITPWPDDGIGERCLTCGKPATLFVDGDCPQCNPPVPPIADEFLFSGDSLGVLAEEAHYAESVERHEDPWGGVGYVVEPDVEDDWIDLGLDENDDEDWDGELDTWMDEELAIPSLPPEVRSAAKTLGFRQLYGMEPPFSLAAELNAKDAEQGLHESDNYDWAEVRFDFLHDERVVITVTGHIILKLEVTPPEPVSFDITYVEFDYGKIEQRVVDEWLLQEGVYSLDDRGCLRDEKNRCLACLRPGPHFPFYYERDKR